jgi:hypothetical protein
MTATPRTSWLKRLAIKDNVDTIIGVLVALYAMAASIADLADVWPWLTRKLPGLTLLLLSVVALYLVIERQSSIKELHESTKEMHKSLTRLDARSDQELRKILEQSNLIRSAIGHVDAFFGAAMTQDRFAQMRLLYASRELAKFSSEQTITLPRECIFPAWLDCLASAQNFEAFNYVRADEVWRSGYFEDVSHGAQVGRIAQGAKVRRVFMVDDEDERQYLEPLMQHQAAAGIDVRWVLSSEVRKLPFIKEHFRTLGTEDIIAIDDELVFRVFLDRDRSMQSCSITRDRQLVGVVKQVFAAAYRIGNSVTVA